LALRRKNSSGRQIFAVLQYSKYKYLGVDNVREFPLEIRVEMLIEHFELNTLENEHFRMRTLENLMNEGLFDDIPLLAKEIKRKRGEILLEPMKTINKEAANQLELWLQFV
jgi:hypothetical protein